MTTPSHTYFKKALQLADQRKGFCAPNPAVGAVIVKKGQIIGEGCHWQAGEPHAEVMALAHLTPEQSQGAEMYVTLEPCTHFGRTPPCTDLIIRHKLQSVYYGFKDPNPLVAGNGQQTLIAAGIQCEHVPIPEIVSFYQSYEWWWKHKRPWVTAKIALSMDGKIAGLDGSPVCLTGPEANVYTHQCRKRADAILTTGRTIIKDNPQLNVRFERETYPKNIYVLDRNLILPETAKIFNTAERVCLFHSSSISPNRRNDLIERGVRCVPLPEKDGKLSLSAALDVMGADGVHELWVEAGGTCFQSLLSEKLVNRVLVYVAPKFLGENAWPVSGNGDVFEGMEVVEWRQMGRDVVCEMWSIEGI